MGLSDTDILESWKCRDGGVCSTGELLEWIQNLNDTTYVKVRESSIYDSDFWFYDDYRGEVLNRKRSYFSIIGMRHFEGTEYIGEQPIIVQPEIGYLGIICKKIDGRLHFLMQAKIEPGNVNSVQISPTIQATKSNFMRAHGGKLPTYFEYFENAQKYEVIYDQIQSEQGRRFYKKRNRNIIILLEEEIDVYANFRWMTLGQIKQFMKMDNIVNMDTRTVLSGIPLGRAGIDAPSDLKEISTYFADKALFASAYESDPKISLPDAFQIINNYKMFKEPLCTPAGLNSLVDWKVDEYGITCKRESDFDVAFFDIEISGREVQHWTQPLFRATGSAVLGLLTAVHDGCRLFLVRLCAEIGSFDKVELGPTVLWEYTHDSSSDNAVDSLFRDRLNKGSGIVFDSVLSEEGGRFYHEQNRNVIIETEYDEFEGVDSEYIWLDYATLNCMVQFNNCLNIQLRNLLSLLDL